jgi:hypothetical protein
MLYEIEPMSPAKWHPVSVSQFARTNKAPLGEDMRTVNESQWPSRREDGQSAFLNYLRIIVGRLDFIRLTNNALAVGPRAVGIRLEPPNDNSRFVGKPEVILKVTD